MTNEMIGWGLAFAGALLLLYGVWPKKKITEALEEVKAAEPVKVEPQITDAVTQEKPKKKTAPVKKAPAKKAPAKKAPVKKVAKKGRK
jgi:outer membrane biosynthesis protein TonB